MQDPSISRRYATALFQTCDNRLVRNKILDELSDITRQIEAVDGGLAYFSNPTVQFAVKIDLLKRATAGKRINHQSWQLLKLLIEKKRFPWLGEILQMFEDMVLRADDIRKAVVRSAVKMSPGDLRKLEQVLQKRLGAKVMVSNLVDPDILGGAVIQIDEMVVDGSIAGILGKLQKIG